MSMIIVGDFAEFIQVTGHPEQMALELEETARAVRKALSGRFGEEAGNAFFDAVIENSRKEKDERDAEADEVRRRLEIEEPELVRAFDASPLVRDLMDSPKNRVVLKGRR